MKNHHNWARLLAYVTGLVNQELLLQSEYLVAENRILRAHLPPRLRLTDPERSTLGELGKRLGRRLSNRWPVSRNQTPFWAGTVGLLPRGLTVQNVGAIQDVRESVQKWKRSWPVSHGEFRLGTRPHCQGFGQPRPLGFGSDGWKCAAPERHRTQPDHDLEGLHQLALGGARRSRFLHSGCVANGHSRCLIGFGLHETRAAIAIQRATFRTRDHCLVCSSLSSVCTEFA